MYELSPSGSLLATLNLLGDSRTPNGAVHDGLEVGSIVVPPVTTPEPASYLLLLVGGLLLLAFCKVRRSYLRMMKIGVASGRGRVFRIGKCHAFAINRPGRTRRDQHSLDCKGVRHSERARDLDLSVQRQAFWWSMAGAARFLCLQLLYVDAF